MRFWGATRYQTLSHWHKAGGAICFPNMRARRATLRTEIWRRQHLSVNHFSVIKSDTPIARPDRDSTMPVSRATIHMTRAFLLQKEPRTNSSPNLYSFTTPVVDRSAFASPGQQYNGSEIVKSAIRGLSASIWPMIR